MKIIDARWMLEVNMILIQCECDYEFWLTANVVDCNIIVCPYCNKAYDGSRMCKEIDGADLRV